MEAFRQEIILSSVVIYMVFCVAVGLWAMRRTHSPSDFFIAGRSLGPLVVALAIFSSTLSGFGFVGGPGLVYSQGVSSFWMIIPFYNGVRPRVFLGCEADSDDCRTSRRDVPTRCGGRALQK